MKKLKIRRDDSDHYGEDPALQGKDFKCTRLNMMHAFNWYASLGDVTQLRKDVETYAWNWFGNEPNLVSIPADLSKAKDSDFTMTVCTLARLLNAGAKLDTCYSAYLHQKIKDIAVSTWAPSQPLAIRHRDMNMHLANIEEMVDQFYLSNYTTSNADIFQYLVNSRPSLKATKEIIDYYTPFAAYLKAEGSYLKPRQRKAYQTFIQAIINDCEKYLDLNKPKKVVKKPRRKRATK